MDIRLVVAGTELHGTLDDTAAARDFAALLPLTVTLADFHSTERIADLPRKLDTTGEPSGTAAQAGDISYYSPWGNLALFYRDFEYSAGLVRLGRFDESVSGVLAGLDADTPATIELTDNRN